MKHILSTAAALTVVLSIASSVNAQDARPKFEVGTVWTYTVSSVDRTVNGKTLTVTLAEKKSSELVFQVSVDSGPAKKVTLFDHDTSWFLPAEYSDGELEIKGIGPFPPAQPAPGKQNVSRSSRTQYQYDDAGRQMGSKTDLIVVTSIGRAACIVPAGRFPCTDTTTKLRSGVLETQVWISGESPGAILHQMQRPKPKTGHITFKLFSIKKPGG